MFLDFNM